MFECDPPAGPGWRDDFVPDAASRSFVGRGCPARSSTADERLSDEVVGEGEVAWGKGT